MDGICGIVNFGGNCIKDGGNERTLALKMAAADGCNGSIYAGEHAVFAGAPSVKKTVGGYEFSIVYCGELYNAEDLRNQLTAFGYEFTEFSDSEVLLYAYIHYGEGCASRLNGRFAFAVWDAMRQSVFLCCDYFGTIPLFYTQTDNMLVFAASVRALLNHPGIKPCISRTGLGELFAYSPGRIRGSGIFSGISELLPCHSMSVNRKGIRLKSYRSLKSRLHPDNAEETREKLRFLVNDSIQRRTDLSFPSHAVLSGECPGMLLPGFYRNTKRFAPFMQGGLMLRKSVLKEAVCQTLALDGCTAAQYEKVLAEVPYLPGESMDERRRRKTSYLDLCRFTMNIHNTAARISPFGGVGVRLPLCDFRIIEYVWNIPLKMQLENSLTDGLFKGTAGMPSAEYTHAVSRALIRAAHDADSPLAAFCDTKKLAALAKNLHNAENLSFAEGLLFINSLFEDYPVRLI